MATCATCAGCRFSVQRHEGAFPYRLRLFCTWHDRWAIRAGRCDHGQREPGADA